MREQKTSTHEPFGYNPEATTDMVGSWSLLGQGDRLGNEAGKKCSLDQFCKEEAISGFES